MEPRSLEDDGRIDPRTQLLFSLAAELTPDSRGIGWKACRSRDVGDELNSAVSVSIALVRSVGRSALRAKPRRVDVFARHS